MKIDNIRFDNARYRKRIIYFLIFLSLLSGLCSCQRERKATIALNPEVDTRIISFTKNGQYTEVLRLYNTRLEEIEEDSYEAAKIHVWLGDFYFKYVENMGMAIKHLEKGCEISEQNQYMLVWADACYVLSSVYIEVENNIFLGLQYAEQAETLYKEHLGENTIEVADTLHNKGLLCTEAEQWQKALQNYEAAEAIYESLDQATGVTCIMIGKTFMSMDKLEQAEEAFIKAHSLAARKKEDYYANLAKMYQGRVCIEKEAYDEAIEHCQEALKYFAPLEVYGDYAATIASIYNNLAYCYTKTEENWEVGIPYEIKACRAIERATIYVVNEKEWKVYYKEKLKTSYEKWRPDSNEDDFEKWYKRVVIYREDWGEIGQ